MHCLCNPHIERIICMCYRVPTEQVMKLLIFCSLIHGICSIVGYDSGTLKLLIRYQHSMQARMILHYLFMIIIWMQYMDNQQLVRLNQVRELHNDWNSPIYMHYFDVQHNIFIGPRYCFWDGLSNSVFLVDWEVIDYILCDCWTIRYMVHTHNVCWALCLIIIITYYGFIMKTCNSLDFVVLSLLYISLCWDFWSSLCFLVISWFVWFFFSNGIILVLTLYELQ